MIFSHAKILFILIFITSCGNKNEDKKEVQESNKVELNPPPSLTAQDFLKAFQLYDNSCNDSNNLEIVKNLSINYWNGTKLVDQKIDLNLNLFRKFDLTAHTQYNIQCKPNANCDQSLDSTSIKIVNKAKDLHFCNHDFNYPDNSYEQVGSNIAYYLQHSIGFYQKTDGQKSMPKLSIGIFPIQELVLNITDENGKQSKLTEIKANNAFWQLKTENFRKNFSIEFLPQHQSLNFYTGKEKLRLHLWNLPLVAAHEFGHHVFYNHAPNFSHNASKNSIQSNGFESEYAANDTVTFSLLNGSEFYSNREYLAIIEATADLFAHISFAEKLNYNSVLCMEKNRDITSEIFFNGLEKKLDKDAVETFLGLSKKPISTSCQDPNFTDLYNTAAVLAFGLNELFALNPEINDLEKNAMLLKTIDKLEKSADNILDQQNKAILHFLNFTIETLISKNYDKHLVCEKAKNTFPYYFPEINTCSA